MSQRVSLLGVVTVLVLAGPAVSGAQGASIPEAEAGYVPTAARLAAVQAAAKRDG